MAKDYAHTETDRQLEELEKKIAGVYKEASDDMQKTVTDYFAKFAERDSEQKKALENGDITKKEYTNWRLTQISRGERYRTMRDQLAERYTNANETAVAYVNDATPGIYSLNRNYAAYTIEETGADVDFTLYDESTVKRLIKESPNLMPNYPEAKAVKRGIDLAYGKEQITASVTSGILQGESVYQIADDLMNRITTMSLDSAIRSARTAITGAQNAGRQDSYEAAEDMGIKMQKRWVATLDDRTRESHIEADGQTVYVDDAFAVGDGILNYPGDPDGEPKEVYNCRCTVIAVVDGVDYKDAGRRGEGKRYEEWLERKEEEEEKRKEQESKLLNDLKKSGIVYRDVKKLENPLTEQQIIDKLGGGDETSGSCASLAYAYMGNKAGFDVTDYRGGTSMDFFSNKRTVAELLELDGVEGKSISAKNEIRETMNLLKSDTQIGKEYCLSTGRHRAIVKRDGDNSFKYLELQTVSNNGWYDLDSKTLKSRFGATKSRTVYGQKVETPVRIVDIESLAGNEIFRQSLGYLNTAKEKQKKGGAGNAK